MRFVLPHVNLTIRNRILEIEGIPHTYEARDVFSVLQNRPFDFWDTFWESPRSFQELVLAITPRTVGFRYGVRFMTLENRLLMTLIWLRQYPTYSMLSQYFGISVPTVYTIIKKMWVILWEEVARTIVWPDRNTWHRRNGKWPEMPNVLGCIDGTSHEILVPQTEPQEEFYSGHRKFHCIHTQVVIDNEKNICHIHSGFLGHDNDAFAYQQMKRIGPGLDLDFPANGFILADSIYPNTRPLVTPYKANEIARLPRNEKRRKRKFNKLHKKRRIFVEHVIKELKTFRVIGAIYRHTRWELSCIVETCAGLAKRRAEFINNLD
ncbi:unnamed protein product [Mytilus edulis]|uniref:DDE Tnp4 domain-containing protein n=1 Tax=Mytilus edulis TaxID=6550 RepID=A0A8S3S1K7_MYTED|nr:unnamed protein product [Mytilus edulis]